MKFNDYYVRMSATPDTYEYDIVCLMPDGSHAFGKYTFEQVHGMFPDVRDNIGALITLQEHGAEILEKTVDTGCRG